VHREPGEAAPADRLGNHFGADILLGLSQELEEQVLVIAARVTADHTGKRVLRVGLIKCTLDRRQIDLGAANNNPDEGLVVGAQSLHGLIEAVLVVLGPRDDGTN